jgi:hypothetical protein
MLTSQNFLIRCGIRMLLGASMITAAVAAMLLGWIITAHASVPMPGASERGENPVLCAIGGESASCPPCAPDEPLLLTRPATLVRPEMRRSSRKR